MLPTDGYVDLVEQGVITGANERTHRNKIITSSALETRRLYDFVDENPSVEFWRVDELCGSSIRERTKKLIGIAHPKFRERLTHQARVMGYV